MVIYAPKFLRNRRKRATIPFRGARLRRLLELLDGGRDLVDSEEDRARKIAAIRDTPSKSAFFHDFALWRLDHKHEAMEKMRPGTYNRMQAYKAALPYTLEESNKIRAKTEPNWIKALEKATRGKSVSRELLHRWYVTLEQKNGWRFFVKNYPQVQHAKEKVARWFVKFSDPDKFKKRWSSCVRTFVLNHINLPGSNPVVKVLVESFMRKLFNAAMKIINSPDAETSDFAVEDVKHDLSKDQRNELIDEVFRDNPNFFDRAIADLRRDTAARSSRPRQRAAASRRRRDSSLSPIY